MKGCERAQLRLFELVKGFFQMGTFTNFINSELCSLEYPLYFPAIRTVLVP